MNHITILGALVLVFCLAVVTRETGVPLDNLTNTLVVALRLLQPGRGSRRGH